uniref:Bromo domain-containing protein n=1 Tax=Cuerna arida TaxID=1464854 RepID=A0A1B6G9D9_9HEMI
MALTLVEGEQSCQESTQVENQLRNRLAKLSINLKNGSNLRLLHILDGESLQSLFMLNPECQIKILEETYLNQTRCGYNNFKIKSDCCPLKKVSKTSSSNKSESNSIEQFSLKDETALEPKSNILSNSNFPKVIYKSSSNCSEDTLVNSNIKCLFVPTLNGLKDDYSDPIFQNTKMIEKIKILKNEEIPASDPSSNEYVTKRSLLRRQPVNACSDKNHNELDSDFEFTLKEENIVSFVCSPTPPRKFKDQSDHKFDNDPSNNDSDQESDKHSERSSSKGDSVSETVSNFSYKSNSIGDMIMSGTRVHDWPKLNNLVWHPPTQQNSLDLNSINKPNVYSLPSSNDLMRPNLHQNIDFHEPVNHNSFLSNQNRLKSSCAQETILFREASLRGCYNLEAILKEINPSLPVVEQEVVKVKEAIFSSIRSKQNNDCLISDSVCSIMDLIKLWIKLNAHFERDDFRNVLEMSGCDNSVFHEFLQWQYVSRMFIEKMIHVLKKISHRNTADMNSISFNHSGYLRTPAYELSFNNVNHSSGNDSKDNKFTSSKLDLTQTKHWKQRRFQLDQTNQEVTETKNKRLLRSNLTVTNTFNSFQLPVNGNTEMVFGQGDNRLSCYNRDFNFDNKNSKMAGKLSNFSEDFSQFSHSSKFIKDTSVLTGVLEKKEPIKRPLINPMKEPCGMKGETNMYVPRLVNENLNCPSINLMNSSVSHRCSINTSNIPTVPPFCNNQPCFINSNQCLPNFGQCQSLKKANPIHCIDTDLGENCIKSNYMKPGSYNPPQKPLTYQKVINNNLPIEDMPVVGIPFLYSNTQTPALIVEVSKSFDTSQSNPSQTHAVLTESRSDDTWKVALSLAESFRESMIASKCSSNPNLKVSETVSLKSHFLLSDEFSQHSSNNEFKLDSENEDSNVFDKSASADIAIPVVEPKLKTTDWLTKSFDCTPPETDRENINAETKYVRSDCESNGINKDCDSISHQDKVKHKHCMPVSPEEDRQKDSLNIDRGLNTVAHTPKTPHVNSIYQDAGSGFNFRKPKKNKKLRDEYTNVFENKPTLLYRKPKSIFKRSMTKHMFCKLEEIFNYIWNTKLCDFDGVDIKPEQDMGRLDYKIRNPLYIQVLKCKLANHSYDTLEQALTDFQQFFLGVKGRNKGDKQCIEVVGFMEQCFLNLVEKHFGLLYQPAPQYFGPIGMAPSLKPRRPKKAPRRF